MQRSLAFLAVAAATSSALAAPPEPKFRAVTLDDKVQIGYGVAVADVDGDKKPDVLLADKKQFVWYKNPGGDIAVTPWPKYVLAENLTKNDNVCIAAQDIDGDGKCEIAVGAEWNPGDTVGSGAVFYLIPPEDRTKQWEPVKFPNVEPTTHRMKWLKLEDGTWGLVVAPLHGRGNKNGQGTPVKVLLYHKPTDPRSEWKSEVIDESMHMTHNFEPALPYPEPAILLGGKEGVSRLIRQPDRKWARDTGPDATGASGSNEGTGEVRWGFIHSSNPKNNSNAFIATVEPMHGNRVVVYPMEGSKPCQLTDQLADGHALACRDVLGIGSDQVIVGWRGNAQKPHPVGIKLFTALDEKGEQWRESFIDNDGMACEDLTVADLNGDGKLDIVASGRATKNLKIYLNETGR